MKMKPRLFRNVSFTSFEITFFLFQDSRKAKTERYRLPECERFLYCEKKILADLFPTYHLNGPAFGTLCQNEGSLHNFDIPLPFCFTSKQIFVGKVLILLSLKLVNIYKNHLSAKRQHPDK